MRSPGYRNTRLSLIFGLTTAVMAVLGTAGAVLLVFLVGAWAGAVTIGSLCCLFGVLRAAWPGRPWFAGRSRATDAAVYLAVGIAVLVFAPLANTPLT